MVWGDQKDFPGGKTADFEDCSIDSIASGLLQLKACKNSFLKRRKGTSDLILLSQRDITDPFWKVNVLPTRRNLSISWKFGRGLSFDVCEQMTRKNS